MKNVLIVGGAGYIGSHMCAYLHERGYQPVVLDNLVNGHREAVQWGPLYKGNMSDHGLLRTIFENHRIEAVMHFAAFAYVGESMKDPAKYYDNNVTETLSLLNAMRRNGIGNFIFSSSCATFGEPTRLPLTEAHPQNPINPYGRTKRIVEEILKDFEYAYGIKSARLRYFNAAGADPSGRIGEDHRPETHLIPIVLQAALGQREHIEIYGDDYATMDGTCIRDYIHIVDLAQAHLLCMERLLDEGVGGAFNLGNGEGYSVKQVVDIARKLTGRPIKTKVVPRRPGDPAALIGGSEKAKNELGWKPRFGDLESIIETAWDWHKSHPDGYSR